MKKIILSILLIFISISSYSQRVIKMEYEGGVYKIPCSVNGKQMKMVFDTGASSVSISSSMANYLYKNHYISKEDFLSKGQSITADGSIVNHQKINLKDVQIGTLHIRNVVAVVIESQNAQLLFGQSALQKIGRYSIDGNNLIIYKGKDHYTIDEIRKMSKEAWNESNNGNYEKAEEIYEEIYYTNRIGIHDIYNYGFACLMNNNYLLALKLFKQIENSELAEVSSYNFATIQVNIFYLIAECYLETGNYDKADFYLEKSVSFIPAKMKVASGEMKSTYNTLKPTLYNNFAETCKELKLYKYAADYFWEGLAEFSKYYGISEDDLWNICVGIKQNSRISQDEQVQRFSFKYSECMWLSYEWLDNRFSSILQYLRDTGNVYATDYLNNL